MRAVDAQLHDPVRARGHGIGLAAVRREYDIGRRRALAQVHFPGGSQVLATEGEDMNGVVTLGRHQHQGPGAVDGDAARRGPRMHRLQEPGMGGISKVDHRHLVVRGGIFRIGIHVFLRRGDDGELPTLAHRDGIGRSDHGGGNMHTADDARRIMSHVQHIHAVGRARRGIALDDLLAVIGRQHQPGIGGSGKQQQRRQRC